MVPEYGAGTENTTFDNDGYIMGYRAAVSIEKGELVVTGGFVGDLKKPDVFARFNRMDDFNFLQAVYTRAIGDTVKASLDYDYLDGGNYARGAIKVDLKKWTKLLDAVLFEDMIGTKDSDISQVFATKLSKRFKNVFGEKGISIDASYVYRTDDFNVPIGDKIYKGQQVRFQCALTDVYKTKTSTLTLFTDYIQSLSDLDLVRFETGLTYKF